MNLTDVFLSPSDCFVINVNDFRL